MASTLSEPDGRGSSALPADYAARRRMLLASASGPGAARRRGLAALTDAWLREVFTQASGDSDLGAAGVALIAVGGYGRGEMALHSDVDIAFVTPWKQTSWCEQVIEAMRTYDNVPRS